MRSVKRRWTVTRRGRSTWRTRTEHGESAKRTRDVIMTDVSLDFPSISAVKYGLEAFSSGHSTTHARPTHSTYTIYTRYIHDTIVKRSLCFQL